VGVLVVASGRVAVFIGFAPLYMRQVLVLAARLWAHMGPWVAPTLCVRVAARVRAMHGLAPLHCDRYCGIGAVGAHSRVSRGRWCAGARGSYRPLARGMQPLVSAPGDMLQRVSLGASCHRMPRCGTRQHASISSAGARMGVTWVTLLCCGPRKAHRLTRCVISVHYGAER